MPYIEQAIVFGKTNNLVGIFCEPADKGGNPDTPVIIFLNSGILHRVGPNRIYVKLSRHLAERGIPSLRFDFSSIGDSPPRKDPIPVYEWVVEETRESMDWVERHTDYHRFILSGICSGADIAYMTAQVDDRVVGLGLIDFFSKASNRYIINSYIKKIVYPRSWKKLFAGESNLPREMIAIFKQTFRRDNSKPENDWPIFQGEQIRKKIAELSASLKIGLFYSQGSPAFYNYKRYFRRFLNLLPPNAVNVYLVEHADHGFTLLKHQERLIQYFSDWLTHTDFLPNNITG